MFDKKENQGKEWRNGVYLCTAQNSFEAELLESKLRSEGVPCVKKHKGAGNYLEIFMGSNIIAPIEIYVPENLLEEAQTIIVPVPIEDEFEEVEDGPFDEL